MNILRQILFVMLLCAGVTTVHGQNAHASQDSWVDEVQIKANNGDPFAQTTLGVCYELGEGVAKDTERAVYWYTQAVEKGWAGGLVRLGKCYAEGIGVAKDSKKAVELWMMATQVPSQARSVQETHIQEALAALARAFRLGEGVQQDMDKAIQFAIPAAEWGLPAAEYELGMCYLAESPHQDSEKAREWLARALDGGIFEAENALQL